MVGMTREGLSLMSTESFHRHISLLVLLGFSQTVLSNTFARMDDSRGLDMAFEEAKQSYAEGGIPVRLTGIVRLVWASPLLKHNCKASFSRAPKHRSAPHWCQRMASSLGAATTRESN